MTEDWISVSDAAELSGYHPHYLRELVRNGKIEARKFGPLWQVSRASLMVYLNDADESKDGRRGPK
jgi:excisionase family DNA binding protein